MPLWYHRKLILGRKRTLSSCNARQLEESEIDEAVRVILGMATIWNALQLAEGPRLRLG